MDAISVTSARHRADIALRVSPSGRHSGTVRSPKQRMKEAALRRLTYSRYVLEASRAVLNIIRLRPHTTWQHGGASTFFRPKAFCSTLFAVAVRCYRPG